MDQDAYEGQVEGVAYPELTEAERRLVPLAQAYLKVKLLAHEVAQQRTQAVQRLWGYEDTMRHQGVRGYMQDPEWRRLDLAYADLTRVYGLVLRSEAELYERLFGQVRALGYGYYSGKDVLERLVDYVDKGGK